MLNVECPLCIQNRENGLCRTIFCVDCLSLAARQDLAHMPDAVARYAREDDEEEDEGQITEKPKPIGRKKPVDDEDDGDEPRSKKSGDKPKKGMGVGMILGIVFGALFLCVCLPVAGVLISVFALGAKVVGDAKDKLEDAKTRTETINNGKNIGLALMSYHDMHRGYPSQKYPTADLSWRVAVLPYLEQDDLFRQMDTNVGWDKGKNNAFVTQRPKVFETPTHPVADTSNTRWQYFTGPNTLFTDPLKKPNMMRDILDGTSNTILISEAQTPQRWSQPIDMVVPAAGPIPVPEGTFIAAFGDCTMRAIDRKKVSDAILRDLIYPNDGKAIRWDLID